MENKQNDEIVDIKSSHNTELWKEFKFIFWTLFILQLAVAGIVQNQSDIMLLIFFGFQIILTFTMVWIIGKYSYAFSKSKKKAFLKSLLGFDWFSFITSLIAYLAVERDYHVAIGKDVSTIGEIFKAIFTIFMFFVVIAILAMGLGALSTLSIFNV